MPVPAEPLLFDPGNDGVCVDSGGGDDCGDGGFFIANHNLQEGGERDHEEC